MTASAFIRRLRSEVRAATIVEFGMILAPFCVLILGTVDLGYRAYLDAQLEGTLQQAARLAAIGDTSGDDIDAYVEDHLAALTKRNYVTITKRSYGSFSRVGKPEKITSDYEPFGEFNDGDCFEDANGNEQYDSTGGNSGIGGSEEVVQYDVSITFPRLVPLAGLLGWSNYQTVTGSTSIQNQPFSTKPEPETVCTTAS